jgi:hypothetical protein
MTPDSNSNASIAVSTQTAIARVRPIAAASLSPVVAEAAAIVIRDADSYQGADLFLFRIRQARKKIADLITPIKKPINEAKAAVMKLEHELDDPLEAAESTIKQRMAAWQIEDRHRVAEEQRRQQEELNRIEREAAAKRMEADRQRLAEAEAARRAQEARTSLARAQAQREAEAARLKTLEAERAARGLELQSDTLAAAPAPEVVKAAGSRVVETIKWRLKQPGGLAALVEAVYAEEVPMEALTTNDRWIEAEWQKDRGMVGSWAGIEVWKETRVGGR